MECVVLSGGIGGAETYGVGVTKRGWDLQRGAAASGSGGARVPVVSGSGLAGEGGVVVGKVELRNFQES